MAAVCGPSQLDLSVIRMQVSKAGQSRAKQSTVKPSKAKQHALLGDVSPSMLAAKRQQRSSRYLGAKLIAWPQATNGIGLDQTTGSGHSPAEGLCAA